MKNLHLKFNYVLFSTQDGPTWKTFHDGYNTICAEELNFYEDTKVVVAPLDHCNALARRLFAVHSSPALAKKINLPLKKLWYPLYFRNDFKNKRPLVFLILNYHLPSSYLEFLKAEYPDCKIVLLFRDLLKVCLKQAPWILENPNIDLIMTFDKGESKKFGYPHFNEYESKVEIPVLGTPESDVFFAGKAKDRLSLLIDVYKRMSSFGMNCKYYLTGVPKEQQVQLAGIQYAEKFMSYREMLYHTVNTRFVLEINQSGADGYTSRFLEAVMYNKKLITNNTFVKQSFFYDPRKIHIFENAKDINQSFIEDSDTVEFNYNGEFSPLRMVERVEEELIKKYGE